MKKKQRILSAPVPEVGIVHGQYKIEDGLLYELDGTQYIKYDPFDSYFTQPEKGFGKKSLYLQFASLNETEPDEILRFANQYGLPSWPPYKQPETAYPLDQFQAEVAQMRSLVKLWEAISEDSEKEKKQYAEQVLNLCADCLQEEGLSVADFKRQISGSVKVAPNLARYILMLSVSGMLRGRFYPVPTLDIKHGQIRESWHIDNLLTAMYLMFWFDLRTENERAVECQNEHCSQRFFITKRPNKIYCSPGCAHAQAQRQYYKKRLKSQKEG